MIVTRNIGLGLLALAMLGMLGSPAQAGKRTRAEKIAYYHAQQRPWHGNYSHTATGLPVPLVVPPTAHMMSAYSWGVAQTEIRPIYHQFGRTFTGGDGSEVDVTSGKYFHPTPLWPSHTDQFGIYPVRGPY